MTSFCFMKFLIFSIVRPYRNDIYNYLDIFILFNLTVIDFLNNGKLNLFLWDNKSISIDWAIRVLLWVPLMMWMALLIMLYRGAIREKCFRIWVGFRDRHENIDEWGEPWFVLDELERVSKKSHFLYLFWIRKKSRLLMGKSYPLKLLDTIQNQGKCFYYLNSREYPASYSFCCCVKLLNNLFGLVKESRFRIFSQNSVWAVAWGKMLESIFLS